MIKLTNNDIAVYLSDCLGYDELMIEELKEVYKPLKTCLNSEELNECINYYL